MVNRENHGSRIKGRKIFVGNAVEGVKGVASWVKDVAVSAWDSVVGAVGTFIEKTGNWISEGLFGYSETAVDLGMTEADYQEWKQYQREQAALGIDVQYSKTKIQIDESEKKGSNALHTIEDFEEEYIKNGKINEKTFFKDYEHIKAFNEYLDAKLDIKKMDDSLIDITNEDAVNLSRTLRQSANEALSIQLQKEYGMSRDEANKVAATSCKAATLYWMLKLNGADIGSYSDFFADNVNRGNISENSGYVKKSTNTIVGQYNFKARTIDNYSEYLSSVSGTFGETRIHVNSKNPYDHSIPTYLNFNVNSRFISDIGSRGYDLLASKKIHEQGTSYAKSEYFKYYQYLEKKKER